MKCEQCQNNSLRTIAYGILSATAFALLVRLFYRNQIIPFDTLNVSTAMLHANKISVSIKMVRGRPISAELRALIIFHNNNGESGREIAKMLKIPQRTVADIIKQFKVTGKTDVGKRTGRKSMITLNDRRALRDVVKKNRFATNAEMWDKWQTAIQKQVSHRTCLRQMNRMGYSRNKVRKLNFD